MEQEQAPPPEESKRNDNKRKSRSMPTPGEMVSYYEKQGMGNQEASLKVIEDLQGALVRSVAANRRRKPVDATGAKIDSLNSRLIHLEMKLDSKPSYPQALALGVASAGIWSGVAQIWNAVRRATSSSPSS